MPQMFPMNWIMMFTFFVFIFTLVVNKLFFTPNNSISSKTYSSFSSPINSWKW